MHRFICFESLILSLGIGLLTTTILTAPQTEPVAPPEASPHVLMKPTEVIERQHDHNMYVRKLKEDAADAQAEALALTKQVAAQDATIAALTQQLANKTFEATHYTARCNGCIGITASGLDVRNTIYSPEGYRVIAVDPNVIALGTFVQVTYDNGTTFTAVASDKGSAIKGNRIDILVGTTAEALELGRVPVQVRLLDK